MPETTTAYRICPLCEATCGLELTIADGRVTARPRRPRRRLQPRLHLPQGRDLRRSWTTTPTGCAARWCARRRRWREVGWDEAFDDGRRRGSTASSTRTAATPSRVYLGNPNVHTLAGALYAGAARAGARHPQRLLRQHRRPDAQARLQRAAVRRPARDPGARPRPHRLPADPRRQPAGVQRQPVHRARLPRAARGAPGARRRPRRRRPAPDPHRRGRRRARLHPAGHRRATCCSASCTCCSTRTWSTSDRLASTSTASTTSSALAATSRPRPVARRRCGIAGRRRSGALARELAAAPSAAVYGRIGTCTAEFGTLASWLVDVVNVLTGNLDRPGGAMFPLAPRTAARGTPAPGTASASGAGAAAVRGLPGGQGRAAGRRARRRDRHARRGPGPRARHRRRQPGAVHARRRPARRGARRPGVHGQRRPVPERDHTPRRRHPAAAAAARERRTTTSRSGPRRAQHGPLLPAGAAAPDRRLDESEILPGSPCIAAGQGAAPTRRGRRPGLARAGARRAADAGLAGRTAATPAELRALLAGDGPAERRLDIMLRLGAYGDGFGADPGGLSLRDARGRPHGMDLGPLRPRLPEVLRTPAGRSSCARRRRRRRRAGCGRRSTGAADGLVLVGRRHLRSNNSWMHNVPALVKGRNRCTLQVHPDDAAALGLADGAAATVASARQRSRSPSRSPTRSCRASSACPTAGATTRPGTRMASPRRTPASTATSSPTAADRPAVGNTVLNGVPVEVQPA